MFSLPEKLIGKIEALSSNSGLTKSEIAMLAFYVALNSDSFYEEVKDYLSKFGVELKADLKKIFEKDF
jgi:hypothetical protein